MPIQFNTSGGGSITGVPKLLGEDATGGVKGNVTFRYVGNQVYIKWISGRNLAESPYTEFRDNEGNAFASASAVCVYGRDFFSKASGLSPEDSGALLQEAKDFTLTEIAKGIATTPGAIVDNLNGTTGTNSLSDKQGNILRSDRKAANSLNVLATPTTDTHFLFEKLLQGIEIETVDPTIDLNTLAPYIRQISKQSSDTALRINISNGASGSDWIWYNRDITVQTNAISTVEVDAGRYKLKFKINWNFYNAIPASTNNPGFINKMFVKGFGKFLDDNYNKQQDRTIYKNIFKYNLSDPTNNLINLINTADGFTASQQSDGFRLVAEKLGRSQLIFLSTAGVPIRPNKNYILFLDYTLYAKSTSGGGDVVNISFIRSGQGLTWSNVVQSMAYPGQRNQTISFARTSAATTYSTEATLNLSYYNNGNSAGVVLDIKIHDWKIIELGSDVIDDPEPLINNLYNSFKGTGYFDEFTLFRRAEKAAQRNSLYDGLWLKSLGDSLPETVSFQQHIARALGMNYTTVGENGANKTIDIGGVPTLIYKSTQGSTRVAPVITSYTGEAQSAGWNIYNRAKFLKYWNVDVLIILAGYNDPRAGNPWITGGTAVQPADYGINDAPYIGGEIDLVSNPAAAVPSFGAAYRGMIENILTDLPHLRIILVGPPLGQGGIPKNSPERISMTARTNVVRTIAAEYGLPFISLVDRYGVNAKNVSLLTKDNLHFSEFGGRRVAQEIIAQCF